MSVCQYPWDIYPQPRPELQICGSSCFHAWFHRLPCVSLNFLGALPPGNRARLSQRLYPQHLGFISICNVSSISSWKSSLTLLHPLLGYILISCVFPAPLQCSPSLFSSDKFIWLLVLCIQSTVENLRVMTVSAWYTFSTFLACCRAQDVFTN